MTRFLVLAATMLVVAAPVSASKPAADAGSAAPEKPKTICRTSPETGTRIAKSKCYTAAQWAELDLTNGEAADQLLFGVSHAAGRVPTSGGSISTHALFGLGGPD